MTIEDLFRELMIRMEDNHREIDRRLDDLDKNQQHNNDLLAEHMRRTALLEETVKPLDKEWTKAKTALFVLFTLASGAGLLGTFGKNLLELFHGGP